MQSFTGSGVTAAGISKFVSVTENSMWEGSLQGCVSTIGSYISSLCIKS